MDKATLIGHLPLFESLAPDEVNALAGRLDERRVDAGAVVFRAGDPGDTLFVVHDGAIEISTGEGKQKTILASLYPGQFFGELSLFDGSPRSATAIALKPCVLQAHHREDLMGFLRNKPDAAVKILGEMAERMRQTNALFSQQVSRDVLEEEEERLTLGQRVADAVAAFGGSWTFIIVFGFVMLVWMAGNSLVGEQKAFDPFPFILLNLALSTCAALQAPVIMMSQNRQASKDKLLAQNDYLVNLKAELGIQHIIKNQGEMMARLALLERQSSPRTGTPSPQDPGVDVRATKPT
jgi:uncharacterized membrane protein